MSDVDLTKWGNIEFTDIKHVRATLPRAFKDIAKAFNELSEKVNGAADLHNEDYENAVALANEKVEDARRVIAELENEAEQIANGTIEKFTEKLQDHIQSIIDDVVLTWDQALGIIQRGDQGAAELFRDFVGVSNEHLHKEGLDLAVYPLDETDVSNEDPDLVELKRPCLLWRDDPEDGFVFVEGIGKYVKFLE